MGAAFTDTTALVFDVAESEVADLRLVEVATDEYTSLTENKEATFTGDEEATFMVEEGTTDETGAAELAGVVVLPETPNSAFLQDPGEHLW